MSGSSLEIIKAATGNGLEKPIKTKKKAIYVYKHIIGLTISDFSKTVSQSTMLPTFVYQSK